VPLLDIRSVSSGYSANLVLREVSIHVEQGEIVALVGANGAGKSTLLNTAMGLVPISSGEILFEGRPITRETTPEIVRSGLVQVPERRQLFGDMSVEENLLLGAFTAIGDTDDRLVEQYQRFPRLSERRTQLTQTLSGGEQQMVAIARALMARPKLLLLDEPSLGLAPLLVAQVIEHVQLLSRFGVTCLLVEQNAKVALGVADRGYILETGRVTKSGTSAQLLSDASVLDAYLGGSGAHGNTMEDRLQARKRAILAE
jgi:branched-chain amino acid transport system ATP-binding protein